MRYSRQVSTCQLIYGSGSSVIIVLYLAWGAPGSELELTRSRHSELELSGFFDVGSLSATGCEIP